MNYICSAYGTNGRRQRRPRLSDFQTQFRIDHKIGGNDQLSIRYLSDFNGNAERQSLFGRCNGRRVSPFIYTEQTIP